MLSQLYIKNVAVISEATIDFTDGLNVFTGETGAGKTILIHAINAVLGERTTRDVIRAGEERAVISALFSGLSQPALDALSAAGYDADEDCALISREITADGKSSCKVNGRPATAGVLREITSQLINVHGQHDNQELLLPAKHLGFIDSFGEVGKQLAEYSELYREYSKTRHELESLDIDEQEKTRRVEMLGYQLAEIDDAQLTPGEEDELKAQRKLAKNAVNIAESLGGSITVLDGDGESDGLMLLLGRLSEYMREAGDYLPAAQPVAERIVELGYEFEGFSADIRDMLEEIDFSPERLDELESRLDVIYRLRKKYGDSVEEILEYRDKIAGELERIDSSGERAQKLRAKLDEQTGRVTALARSLSKQRAEAAEKFSAAVRDELIFLDMPSVELSVRREDKPLSPDGIDAMELFIRTNVGEQVKSLSKIASGGELARIMLSIKNVLADRDGIQTLIFDEVDTGVSGRAAQKIGKKLSQVARDRQVIVVTHLAQVASFARRHLLISKTARDDRTYTEVAPLSGEERVGEIARILGGESVTELAIEHAREMLGEAQSEVAV